MISQLSVIHWGNVKKVVNIGGFGRGKIKKLGGRQFSCTEYDTMEPERIPIFIIIDKQQLERIDYE